MSGILANGGGLDRVFRCMGCVLAPSDGLAPLPSELRQVAPSMPVAPPLPFAAVALVQSWYVAEALRWISPAAAIGPMYRRLEDLISHRGDETALFVDWLPWLREARAELGEEWPYRRVCAFGPEDGTFREEAAALGVDEVIHVPAVWVDPGAEHGLDALEQQRVLVIAAWLDWLRRRIQGAR